MRNIYSMIVILLLLVSCNNSNNTKEIYKDHIGDTSFNSKLDAPSFKFCDSTNILHSRSKIHYNGGTIKFEDDLLEQYILQPEFENFNGFFFIRFAVNCNDEIGRIRWDVVDSNFQATNCPLSLERNLISIVKKLNNWSHPVSNNKDYDGYSFLIIKIENGEIIKS